MSRRIRVYGPVPSRRFGLSLGVDVVPHKVCSYDCIYCQLGMTTKKTITRRLFYPVEDIVGDVRAALATGPSPDVITLAGSGEPTLYAGLGRLIRILKELTEIPVVLLTNGGMLFLDDVLADIMAVDILAPSLDAGDEVTFERVNQPCQAVTFHQMTTGLMNAISRFRGDVRLEVMIIKGVSDSGAELGHLTRLVKTLAPGSIDINTPVRPHPSASVSPCSARFLHRLVHRFGPGATIIADFKRRSVAEGSGQQASLLKTRVLAMLSRRPCSVEDVSRSMEIHRHEAIKLLDLLLEEKAIQQRRTKKRVFFWAPVTDTIDHH